MGHPIADSIRGACWIFKSKEWGGGGSIKAYRAMRFVTGTNRRRVKSSQGQNVTTTIRYRDKLLQGQIIAVTPCSLL